MWLPLIAGFVLGFFIGAVVISMFTLSALHDADGQ